MSKLVPALLIAGITGYLIYSLVIRKETLRPPTPTLPSISIPTITLYEVVRG